MSEVIHLPHRGGAVQRPGGGSAATSVTGRDSYIVAEALHRYIVTEQAKPDSEQSKSNLRDARAIFDRVITDMGRQWEDLYGGGNR